MTPRTAGWVVFAAMAVGSNALAQGAAPAPARRDALAQERAAVEQRFADQERTCRDRFAVTACLDEARRQRRAALAPLRQEELRIDSDERKQRAAARLSEIEAKQRADAARDAAAASAPNESRPAPSEPPRPSGRLPGGSPKTPLPVGARARREAESEARFQRQQDEAARHRAEVEARNAERAAKGKVAKPLPPPPAASGP